MHTSIQNCKEMFHWHICIHIYAIYAQLSMIQKMCLAHNSSTLLRHKKVFRQQFVSVHPLLQIIPILNEYVIFENLEMNH